MSEYTENKVGQIQIADEVIAIIAALGTIYLIQNNCRPKEVSP